MTNKSLTWIGSKLYHGSLSFKLAIKWAVKNGKTIY